ncbi:MAG: trans-splicing intein-formed DNA polymerase III subunit alpha C-terminal partner DnaE-C [Chamaesiphon sp.]
MVKIISRKPLGIDKVYDIGVASNHNFIIKNGLVASNCFNKSHSTAYAYVTYQTAYLKANYPVEYMAALLTAHSGDQDKVQKYISTCQNINIQVEPPDINRSGVDFTPLQDSILFGLSAVRNVGQGAIDSILTARDKGGEFKSLADLCDRIDLRALNRRTLEALIYCGAFDTIESNRQQLIKDLEFVIDWAQSRAKDRTSGQGNIFDLLGGMTSNKNAITSYASAPKAPSVADFSPQEKLRREKEILGFYVSDHPLKSVRKSAQVLSPINLSDVGDLRQDAFISAVVIVISVKQVVTKKGERMAILQIEDLTSQAEAVVFPKTYERINTLLEEDARLIIWGKVDRRDEKNQLIVDDAEPIEQVHLVMVELTPQQASDRSEQHRLMTNIKSQSGESEKAKVPVIAIVASQQQRHFVRLGRKFWVQNHQTTVDALNADGFEARFQSLTSF